MIALRPGSSWPSPGPDRLVMVPPFPGRVGLHQSDEIAHRTVRPARRITIGRVMSSCCLSKTHHPGGITMTTSIPATLFADPAPAQRLERAAAALTAHGFTVEILDDVAAARSRVKDLIPEGASVFTGASETLRLSGIDADINTSGRYDAIKSRGRALDPVRDLAEIWRLMSAPDVI